MSTDNPVVLTKEMALTLLQEAFVDEHAATNRARELKRALRAIADGTCVVVPAQPHEAAASPAGRAGDELQELERQRLEMPTPDNAREQRLWWLIDAAIAECKRLQAEVVQARSSPAPDGLLREARDLLDWCAVGVKCRVKAEDLEAFPYQPAIEACVAKLDAALAAPDFGGSP